MCTPRTHTDNHDSSEWLLAKPARAHTTSVWPKLKLNFESFYSHQRRVHIVSPLLRAYTVTFSHYTNTRRVMAAGCSNGTTVVCCERRARQRQQQQALDASKNTKLICCHNESDPQIRCCIKLSASKAQSRTDVAHGDGREMHLQLHVYISRLFDGNVCTRPYHPPSVSNTKLMCNSGSGSSRCTVCLIIPLFVCSQRLDCSFMRCQALFGAHVIGCRRFRRLDATDLMWKCTHFWQWQFAYICLVFMFAKLTNEWKLNAPKRHIDMAP